MISSGTLYAFAVLSVGAALYLALRLWYGQGRLTAGGLATLVFGLLTVALLVAHRVTGLDAAVALAGGVLGRWIFEPSHAHERHARPAQQGPPDTAMELSAAVHGGHAPGDPSPSLDLVLHQIERRADLALQEANALDNKAGFVLGAASFLLLGVTGLQGVVATHMMEHDTVHVVQWLAVGSVMIYLGVVSAALMAYMVHASVLAPDPVTFLEHHRSAPPEQTKRFLLHALLHSFSANQRIVEKKAQWTRRALRAFLAETLFLALILVTIAVNL